MEYQIGFNGDLSFSCLNEENTKDIMIEVRENNDEGERRRTVLVPLWEVLNGFVGQQVTQVQADDRAKRMRIRPRDTPV